MTCNDIFVLSDWSPTSCCDWKSAADWPGQRRVVRSRPPMAPPFIRESRRTAALTSLWRDHVVSRSTTPLAPGRTSSRRWTGEVDGDAARSASKNITYGVDYSVNNGSIHHSSPASMCPVRLATQKNNSLKLSTVLYSTVRDTEISIKYSSILS